VASRSLSHIIYATLISCCQMLGAANAGDGYIAEKTCGIRSVPPGFDAYPDFFSPLSPDLKTPFSVFQNKEMTSLLVSNIEDGCWLRIESFDGPWVAAPINPVYSAYKYKNSRSRALAFSTFENLLLQCDPVSPTSFLKKYYFYESFARESMKSTSCVDCASLCFEAPAYGTIAIQLTMSGRILIVDLVAGQPIIGEVK
jgi:hypothetical protein